MPRAKLANRARFVSGGLGNERFWHVLAHLRTEGPELNAGSAICSGASNLVPGTGTYTLAGGASTPSDATKVNLVIA